jgi:hypothetical protein
MQESIESNYVDGRPLHHLPSARFSAVDTAAAQSSIFVVGYSDFMKLPPATIQEIFSHRHIMVLGTPLQDEGFNLDTLDQFANIEQIISIQGELFYKKILF